MIKSIIKGLSMMDKLLIIVLILSIAVLSLAKFGNGVIKSVMVYKDNYLVGEYPLTMDREIIIDEHNTVRIKNNKVSMIHTDCPDKRCVKQGTTSFMPIICLPNKVHVKIQTNGDRESHLILH
ncbi:MAG: NusG domain II-containing protein [Candidatus Cloacimonetes bacterium]|nr:NusG domain II-containing protein [Candidatus Cloacimonadota bacterium]